MTGLLRLIFLGLGTQFIYGLYTAVFPLLSNIRPGQPAADLEILMRDYRWFAPVYTVGLLLLYYLFWQAVKTAAVMPALIQARVKLLVLAFGLLFGFTLTWLYPITAIDLFGYVIRGRVWAVYGESPMLVAPNQFPDDPYLVLAGEFDDLPSVYGPLWELLVQLPLRLGATEIEPAAVSLKLMILLFFLACAILIGWVARFPSGPPASAGLVGLTFFAWNPLILMQGLGNGHNDMVFMALTVLGFILWQRQLWWAAGLALALAVTAKFTALLLLPMLGIALLRPGPDNPPGWRPRLGQAVGAGLIALVTILGLYLLLGPLAHVFLGMLDELTTRRGFTIASNLRVILREIIPPAVAETLPRTTARYIFMLFYLWLLLQLWRGRLNLVTAGFLAYFGQIVLGATFRIWYPTWLVPLAALQLTPATFWRTTLFGLTAELSLVNYFVVWRWWLRELPWGKNGPLAPYWNYWTIMYTLTVPWVFGIPLFGPILLRWRRQKNPPS